MKITKKNGQLLVKSPYNADFVKKVKEIGGKWNGDVWSVPEENKQLLKDVLIAVYGEGVDEKVQKVTVTYKASDFEDLNSDSIRIGTAKTVTRRSRDYPVSFYFDTIVFKGSFLPSGGSAKYPFPSSEEGTVLRSKIPVTIYEALEENEKQLLTIEGESQVLVALKEEREKLLKRIEEINLIIAQTNE